MRQTHVAHGDGPDISKSTADRADSVDLLWIPLGAGQRVVRISGRLFEALCAFVQRRPRRDLYHSALIVRVPDGRFVVEMTPIPDQHGERRGVVAEGAVGTRYTAWCRLFRYEIHRWHDGVIPDEAHAVSTIRLTTDVASAQRLLDLVPRVPCPVWGRDELDAGEMWNSNSVTSWLLASAAIDIELIRPPRNGRAPGWRAGAVVAARCPARHEVRAGV
jgi:hypothetical protein